MFVCCLCNSFGGNSFSSVLHHIGEIHRHDPNLTIDCGIEGCPQTYKRFESFRSHVYRKHRYVQPEPPQPNVRSSSSFNHLNQTPPLDPPSNNFSAASINAHVGGKFIMKTREVYNIPQSTVNNLLEDVTGLYRRFNVGAWHGI